MKLYKCDLCKKTYVGKPKVETLGVAGHGGILLPEYLHSNEFCSPEHNLMYILTGYRATGLQRLIGDFYLLKAYILYFIKRTKRLFA